MRVAVVLIRAGLCLELGQHRHPAGALRVQQVPRREPLTPLPVDEDPFLRRMAQVPWVVDRFAVWSVGLDQPHLVQELSHRGRLRGGHRQIVCAPRVGGHLVLSPACVAAGVFFQFEEREVVEAAFGQFPGGGQARHPSTQNAHPHVPCRPRLREPAFTQAVAGLM